MHRVPLSFSDAGKSKDNIFMLTARRWGTKQRQWSQAMILEGFTHFISTITNLTRGINYLRTYTSFYTKWLPSKP
jgi:hypothetical protein